MIRIPVWAVAVLMVVVPTIIWAGDVMLPHVFMPETTIKSAEVNANFDALRAEASASDRIVVSGGGVVIWTGDNGNGGTYSQYVTPLSHPLLNNNPNALLFVTKDITGDPDGDYYDTCRTSDDQETNVYYEQGKWWIYSTCPQLKYHVLIFRGTRASP
ncbi:DUF7452 domain-containing protein [Hyalangium gracile]|uniref:DUF7452 domain-containing protein n=1 Tax=Hyalangium gracile TaxID=394092 RepID=UPI001CCC2FF4|nr:hypothetical protein [Hyalangium gracile]